MSFNVFTLSEAADNPFDFCNRLIKISIIYLFPAISAGFSLRDKIMREVCLNMLIHREYSSAYPTTLTIWNDRIETENWNVPYVYGRSDLQTLKPHRKNPIIANVFSQMGIVEELGSGTKKMFKYTPLFSDGKEPMIEEQDVYRITIPYAGITGHLQTSVA